MLPSYRDIRDAVRGVQPTWWDMNGVPRYAPFHPSLLGVYDELAILMEIQCSDPICGAKLHVAEGTSRLALPSLAEVQTLGSLIAGFCYGDPPAHDCPGWGETASYDTLSILQAWTRHAGDWVHHPAICGHFTVSTPAGLDAISES